MRFEFSTATRIIFGAGVLAEAGSLARSFGGRALVVTGNKVDRASVLFKVLAASNVCCHPFPVSREPSAGLVSEAVSAARLHGCDLVISFGGGSAIDTGKATAALLTNAGDIWDYLEVVGGGRPLVRPAAPFIAVPTTAGSGAEVTRNAVFYSPDHRVKVSMRSPLMLPRAAVIDPDLTRGLPPGLTATTGLDAVTQLIEPFVSIRSNPLVDSFCREGLSRVRRSLRRAWADGQNYLAREDMALASLLGGLALTNAGLGAVHGLAAAIGGSFDAPHGAVCAALLPAVMEINLRALEARSPESSARARFLEIAQILTGDAGTTCEEGIAWVRHLCDSIGIQSLKSFGILPTDLPGTCEKAMSASSMKSNPIQLTANELGEALRLAF